MFCVVQYTIWSTGTGRYRINYKNEKTENDYKFDFDVIANLNPGTDSWRESRGGSQPKG